MCFITFSYKILTFFSFYDTKKEADAFNDLFVVKNVVRPETAPGNCECLQKLFRRCSLMGQLIAGVSL